MPLSPETIWSEVISLPDLIGGAHFYSEYQTSVSCDEFMQPGTVLKISCSDFDENVHIDANSALHKKIYEFDNGVYIGIRLYMTPAHDNVPAHVKGDSYITNGTTYNFYNTGINGWLSTGAYCSSAALKTYGMTVFLVTNYLYEASGQGGVIPGLTRADSIHLHVLLPYQSGSGLQSWDHINQNDFSYVMANIDDPSLPFAPVRGYYYGGNGTEGNAFTYDICSFTDLSTLISSVNSLGDPLPDDDIYKKRDIDNPAQDIDPSTPGGGNGSYTPIGGGGKGGYDPGTEPVDVPALPSGGAISTGSIKAFLVTEQKIQSVFQRLWNSNLFDVLTWQKLIQEPMDAIVSLTCIPCLPTVGSGGHIQLGNIDTEVIAPVITNEYKQLNLGSVKIGPYWGSALDYSPYTKIECYFPGIGIRPLKPEDVIDQQLTMVYNYDILTGNFSANLKCGLSVLYKFSGNLKATVPLTSRIFSALESVMKGAGMAATQYATGAMAASEKKDATPESVRAAGLHAAGGAAISAAVNVAMSKVNLQRSGDLSGSVGLLDDFVPYIIIHRPVQSLANDFKSFKGYPSNITSRLASLSGYTEVEYIHLTGISGATDAELNEIEALLKSGVII